jgi:hypothetical protein
MRRVAAFFRRHVAHSDRLGLGEDLGADLLLVVPLVRLRVGRRLLRMADREQTHRHRGSQGALGHRRRARQQENLFGLVARVVDDRHAGLAELQAGTSRNHHNRFHPAAGFIASSRGTNALVDSHGHWRVVARHGQGG